MDVDRTSTKPPRWYKKHKDARPCTCSSEHHETIRRATRYSDFAYRLRQCRLCGHKWGVWIEG